MPDDHLKEKLIKIVEELPTKEEDLLGFDVSLLKGLENFLTEEEKSQLVAQIKSEEFSKAATRRLFAAVSGAVKLASILV